MDVCIVKRDIQDTFFNDPALIILTGEKAEIIAYTENTVTIEAFKSVRNINNIGSRSPKAVVSWSDIELI